MSTPVDRIDAVSRRLIENIKTLRTDATEYRARAADLDTMADALRAELGDWNLIRSHVPDYLAPIPYVLAEGATS